MNEKDTINSFKKERLIRVNLRVKRAGRLRRPLAKILKARDSHIETLSAKEKKKEKKKN